MADKPMTPSRAPAPSSAWGRSVPASANDPPLAAQQKLDRIDEKQVLRRRLLKLIADYEGSRRPSQE